MGDDSYIGGVYVVKWRETMVTFLPENVDYEIPTYKQTDIQIKQSELLIRQKHDLLNPRQNQIISSDQRPKP